MHGSTIQTIRTIQVSFIVQWILAAAQPCRALPDPSFLNVVVIPDAKSCPGLLGLQTENRECGP